jgi:hypothetical protein
LRLHEDIQEFVPIEWVTPALGIDIGNRDAAADGFNLMAIARHAAALGRVPGRVAGEAADAALALLERPLATDLTVRATSPELDPILAGVVVTLGGTLAFKPDHIGGRRRRPPTFRPER